MNNNEHTSDYECACLMTPTIAAAAASRMTALAALRHPMPADPFRRHRPRDSHAP